MNGLVYSLDDDGDNTPVYWMGIALAALLVHGLMFFGLPFNGNPPPSVEEPVTVTLDDSLLNMLENATATTTLKPELQPAKTELVAQQPKIVPAPPVPSDAPASIVEPPPLIPEKPKAPMPPPAVKPVAKEDAKDATSEKKPLNDKDLPSLKDHPESAFDVDTNTSKLAPREAYLSDRNSTAADRGPKNLPQGDPYIDKGDTNLIKYLGKRGEGNKPAVASDANSGSIKKEGSEESGDGGGKQAKDLSKTTRTAELLTPLPKDTPLKAEPADKTVQPAKIAALEKIEEPVAPQPAPRHILPASLGDHLLLHPAQHHPQPRPIMRQRRIEPPMQRLHPRKHHRPQPQPRPLLQPAQQRSLRIQPHLVMLNDEKPLPRHRLQRPRSHAWLEHTPAEPRPQFHKVHAVHPVHRIPKPRRHHPAPLLPPLRPLVPLRQRRLPIVLPRDAVLHTPAPHHIPRLKQRQHRPRLTQPIPRLKSHRRIPRHLRHIPGMLPQDRLHRHPHPLGHSFLLQAGAILPADCNHAGFLVHFMGLVRAGKRLPPRSVKVSTSRATMSTR